MVESHRDSMTIQVCPVRHTLAHRRRYPVPPSRSHPLALLSEETLQSTHRPGPTGREAGIMYPECPEVRLNFTLSQTLILFRKRTLRDKGRMPRCRAAAMSFWRNDRTSSLIAMPVVNIRQIWGRHFPGRSWFSLGYSHGSQPPGVLKHSMWFPR